MATKPTPGGSDGTYGTELNAFLDVSLASDGKIINEALQTDATAPVADAALANKLYTDTKEAALVTQSTASIFGPWTDKDSGGSVALAKDEIYRVGSDGFVYVYKSTQNATIIGLTDSSNPPTTIRQQANHATEVMCINFAVRKDDYWKVTITTGTPTIFWLPIGTGTSVKQ